MVKITIEYDDGTGTIFEADDLKFSLENGVAFETLPLGLQRAVPNGQQRILIKAWRGCAGYDHFTTEAKHTQEEH